MLINHFVPVTVYRDMGFCITDHLVFGIGGWGMAWVTKSFPQYILRPSVLTSYLKVNIGCLSKVIREKCF